MKKRIALGCIVPLVLVFGGCVAIVASSDSTTAPTTQASSDPSENIPLSTMTNVRPDRAVQVDSLELVDSIAAPYGEPLTGGTGKLAVLYFQVQNTGNESGSLVFSSYDLVDSQGRNYSEISDFMEAGTVWSWAESEGPGSASKQLFPGETAPTAKVFRVAPDAEGLQAVINGKTFVAQ